VEFVLLYTGPLKSNGDARTKNEIRRALHPQLKKLWALKPLSLLTTENYPEENIDGIQFRPLVRKDQDLTASLDVTMMVPENPKGVLDHRGDIDNRLKTLFDALRMPREKGEIPRSWRPADDERPLYCLLQDDCLVARIGIGEERWLQPDVSKTDVVLFIRVIVSQLRTTWERPVAVWGRYSGP